MKVILKYDDEKEERIYENVEYVSGIPKIRYGDDKLFIFEEDYKNMVTIRENHIEYIKVMEI